MMPDKLVIASGNKGKVAEIRELLAELPLEILSLEDYPKAPGVVEDGESFFVNALKKARILAEYTGLTVLADDSGLEVEILQGAPGIRSARYAGEGATDEDNNRRLLAELAGLPPEARRAAFCCVLVFYRPNGTFERFTGRWSGIITDTPRGDNGFGYDPLFFLPERGLTVAELSREEKNRYSHRAQAVLALKNFLRQEVGN